MWTYTKCFICAEKDLLKRVRREPKGSVAQELGRNKRKMKEEADMETSKKAKLELISFEDFVNELRKKEETGELSNAKKHLILNLL